jgi:hypothetical protein
VHVHYLPFRANILVVIAQGIKCIPSHIQVKAVGSPGLHVVVTAVVAAVEALFVALP